MNTATMTFQRLPSPALRRIGRWLLLAAFGAAAGLSFAQSPAASKAGERSIAEWLNRLQMAPRQHSYIGTFVVSSNAGAMSSARIWHACDAERQVERVENLTGAPRSTFRHNDEVVTFFPEQKLVRTERRESLGRFPQLPKSTEASIGEYYAVRVAGSERVAGFDADVVHLAPRDALRFGYRIWSERRTGLMVKMQTLGLEGEVLEQAAFSELALDPSLRTAKLVQMMTPPEGWRVERSEAVKTTAEAEGWTLKSAVAGFAPTNCYWRRAAAGDAMQWAFSDGLTSVSLFVEPFDRQRHLQESVMASGATHTLTRRIQDWWLTAVGEVPPQTLRAFAQNLERRK